MGVSTVRSSSIAFLSFYPPPLEVAFPVIYLFLFFHRRLVRAFFLCCRMSPSFPKFKPHSSPTGPPRRTLLPTPAVVSPITFFLPSVNISSLILSEASQLFLTLSRNWSQATSTIRSLPHLTVVLLSRFSPGYFCAGRLLVPRLPQPLPGRWTLSALASFIRAAVAGSGGQSRTHCTPRGSTKVFMATPSLSFPRA